jgi:hypothetical protein
MEKAVYKELVRSEIQPGEWEYPTPLIGEWPTTLPTPTQAENDQLGRTAGAIPMIKTWDLSPIDPQSFDPFEPPGRPTAPVLPPVNTLPPQVQVLTDLAVGSQLVSTTGTWNPAGTTYNRQWWRNTPATPIGVANSVTYNIVAADVGNMIGCTVTAVNAGGSVPVQTATVGPCIPANTVLPAVTGSTVVGGTLTCSNGTWSPNVGLTYARQWFNAGNQQPILGATGTTYITQNPQDVGTTIACSLTVTQTASGAQSNPARSNVVGPITTTDLEDPGGGDVVQPTRQQPQRRR